MVKTSCVLRVRAAARNFQRQASCKHRRQAGQPATTARQMSLNGAACRGQRRQSWRQAQRLCPVSPLCQVPRPLCCCADCLRAPLRAAASKPVEAAQLPAYRGACRSTRGAVRHSGRSGPPDRWPAGIPECPRLRWGHSPCAGMSKRVRGWVHAGSPWHGTKAGLRGTQARAPCHCTWPSRASTGLQGALVGPCFSFMLVDAALKL